jgi:hypothetical protein
MDWLILHRGGAEFSLPLRDVDRVVSWSSAMTWIGQGGPAGLIFGDVPPMVVSEPSLVVQESATLNAASQHAGLTVPAVVAEATVSAPVNSAADATASNPTGAATEPRFIVLRDRRNGDCGVALVADRVDLALQARGTPILISPSRDIHR